MVFSTTNALWQLMESINSGIDRGQIPLPIFIDIRKAFDTVDFRILSCMESLGVHGKCLKWFETYLTGRSPLKKMFNDMRLAVFTFTCGVPQGSVVGTQLYLIYVDLMHLF